MKGLLVKIEPKAHPHAAIRYAAATRPSSLFHDNLLQLLLLSLTNFNFTTPRIEPKTIFVLR